MPISITDTLLVFLVSAAAVFSCRVLPFFIFRGGKNVPPMVHKLGVILPPAVIGALVVFCLRDVSLLSGSHGLPELIAGAAVVLLHIKWRNNLLSIGAGTVLYMVLVQLVF